MMEEDSSLYEVIASSSKVKYQRKVTARPRTPSQRPCTPPPSSSPPKPFGSGSCSPSLALKFDGKVYRTLPPSAGLSRTADFFGEPDESIIDLAHAQADRRRAELEREMRLERSARKRPRSESDEELHVRGSPNRTPTKRSVPFNLGPSPPKPRTPFVLGSPGNAPPPPALNAPFALGAAAPISSSASDLAKPLADLLALHIAIESVLLLHLSTSGSLIASASSAGKLSADGTSTTVRMPALIDLPDLAKKLASGGKRCAEQELAKLVWAWSGAGQAEESEEEEELTVTRGGKGLEAGEVGGMGFIVSRMRVHTPQGIVNTYGLGISVQLKTHVQRPKLELLPPPSPERSPARRVRTASAQDDPPSPGVGGGRDGMTVVALWSQGARARRTEFTRRLRDFAQRNEREVKPENALANALRLPLATLPPLAHALPTISATPSPHKPKPIAGLSPGLTRSPVPAALGSTAAASGSAPEVETDVFGPVIPIKGGIKSRREAMMERLAAKAAARSPSLTLPLSEGAKSLGRDKDAGTERRMAEMAHLKRRSMLSRLPAVVDVIWMMFQSGQKRAIRLGEVAEKVAKSAGAGGTSEGEAAEAVRMLVKICPEFVALKMVAQHEWIAWGRGLALAEVKRLCREELGRSYPVEGAEEA